jgi:hypothetical protein
MNANELCNYIRELGSLPDGRFSDAELLQFADQETLMITRDIISVRQDFLVEQVPVSLASSTDGVRIPPRAIGGKVRDIVVQDAPGNSTTPGNYVAIPRIDMSDRYANPVGYYYTGNNIMFWNVVPAMSSQGAQVLLNYYARPGQLILTGSALRVTSVDTVNGAVTGSGASMSGVLSLDVTKGTTGFESALYNKTTYVPVGFTVGNMGTDVASVEVGDWVSPSGYSPVPQLPIDFHQILAQRVIVKCLESIGDNEGFQRAQSKATEMQNAALSLIAERDDGNPEKLRLDVFSPWVRNNRWIWPR